MEGIILPLERSQPFDYCVTSVQSQINFRELLQWISQSTTTALQCYWNYKDLNVPISTSEGAGITAVHHQV
jgi:hypothetical protein